MTATNALAKKDRQLDFVRESDGTDAEFQL